MEREIDQHILLVIFVDDLSEIDGSQISNVLRLDIMVDVSVAKASWI